MFDGMGEDFDDIAALLGPEPVSPPTPAVAATATPPAVPEPPTPQVAPPPAEPAPVPQAPPPVQPQVAPPAAAAPPSRQDQPVTVDSILETMQKQEAQLLQQILPSFQLSPEVVTELELNAKDAVPKLLAGTYMKAVDSSLKYIRQLVPDMIAAELGKVEKARQLEGEFLAKFPALNASHTKDIKAIALALRQQNPAITKDQLWHQVGTTVMVMHGLSAQAAAPVAKPQQQAKPVAFQPAANGGAVVQHQPVRSAGGWDALGMDFDD